MPVFERVPIDVVQRKRLRQIGVTPLADTSIRLLHHGRYGYGWEDAGADRVRYPTYFYKAEANSTAPDSGQAAR